MCKAKGSKRRISVNLADRQASMELLKQLYTKGAKDGRVQTQNADHRRGQSTASPRAMDAVHETTRYPHTK